jgi:TRAP-type C4-dicarboxylate transport system substrate-binding protein
MKRILRAASGLGLVASMVSAPAGAQVVLNASSWVPPAHPLTATILVPLCEDIARVTSGRVKCNVLPKAPVAPPQTFDAIANGVVDLSFTSHGYTPGRFALTEAAEFPFMGDTAEVTAVAYQRIYERMLAKADEHRGVVVLSVFTHGPGEIYNARRAINTLKDFDGLKIRVGGGVVTDVARALGTVPILKPAPESYELLSSGVVDGVFFPKESPLSFKFIPLIKYVTLVPGGLYNTSFVWMANPAKWSAIPEADRRLIAPLLGEALARRSGRAWDTADAKGVAAMQEAKLSIETASPQLIAEIRAKTSTLENDWIEKKAKPKGVDGAAVLKALRAEIASLQKK